LAALLPTLASAPRTMRLLVASDLRTTHQVDSADLARLRSPPRTAQQELHSSR
jgi:hypothetical protein